MKYDTEIGRIIIDKRVEAIQDNLHLTFWKYKFEFAQLLQELKLIYKSQIVNMCGLKP